MKLFQVFEAVSLTLFHKLENHSTKPLHALWIFCQALEATLTMPFQSPLKKFLNASDLCQRKTNAAPIATIAAITKPTGPRKLIIAVTAVPIHPPILLKIFRPPTATLASVEVSDMKYNAELAALEPLAIPNKAVPTLVALCKPPKTLLVVLTALFKPQDIRR